MNTKIRIILLFIFFLPSIGGVGRGLSQSQVTQEWLALYPGSNIFNAEVAALVLDDSSNVYITGSILNFNQIYNYTTIKYNALGIKKWSKIYTGTNTGGRFPRALAIDSNHNVYVAGYDYGISSSFDYCTIKYNSAGEQKWLKTYDNPSHGIDEAEKVAVDRAGNIYVSGYSETNSNRHATTIKYSNEGNTIWIRTDTLIEDVRDMLLDDYGNLYIAGNYNGARTLKYDSSGNVIWRQAYTGYGTTTGANSITIDNNLNIFITGESQGIHSYRDMFTVKYSASGGENWIRRYNPDTLVFSRYVGNVCKTDITGNICITGYYESNQSAADLLIVLKYSTNGELLWVNKESDTCGQHQFMDKDKSGNIYIAAPSPSANWLNSIAIFKYDSSGTRKWVQNYLDTFVYPSGIIIDENENIIISGSRGLEGFNTRKMCTVKYSQLVSMKQLSTNFPQKYRLYQNYPNPFNPKTIFKFDIPKESFTKLILYDLLGREVETLINSKLQPGTYETEWDGTNFASGIYFYKLEADDFVNVKKMVLLK